MASTSRFCEVKLAKPIEVFALIAAFNEDKDPRKVNLSVGAYRSDEGKPWVLPVVKTVEAQMATDPTLNHEYLPVAGLPDFRTKCLELLLGCDSPAISENRVEGIQAPGGTGALRVAADFLHSVSGYTTVYVSNPTWGNHKGIFQACGFTDVKDYRYWDEKNKGLDIEGMISDLKAAPQGKAVVILHAVAHNPTGVDPTREQWQRIADVCKEKDLFVVMDIAYQGFATGDLDADAWSVREFVKQGFELFIAQSFSKNFGLYNERTGNLCVVCKDSDTKCRVRSQMELVVRKTWSNPPNHGARIVATVLNNPSLTQEWNENVKTMSERIKLMRKNLQSKLRASKCPGNWDHIVKQIGMFSYTGLNSKQATELQQKYHIYLMNSGRINMCGLTPANIDYVADAITQVLKGDEEKCSKGQPGQQKL